MAVLLGSVSTTPPPGSGPDAPPAVIVPSYGEMAVSSSRGTIRLQGAVEAVEGWEGLGPARRSPLRSSALGRDGSVRSGRRPYTVGGRRISGPVHIGGTSPDHRAQLMEDLMWVVSPLDGEPVRFTINRRGRPVYVDGDALFEGGREFMAFAAYDSEAVVQLDIDCPDPFFREVLVGDTLTGAQASEPFFPIFPVELVNSNSFGAPRALAVGGDSPAWPTVTAVGPLEQLTLTSSTGAAWRVDLTDAPLLGGETLVVRTDATTGLEGRLRVEGPGGESYWRYLDLRRFFPLLPRTDSVTVDVEGASSSTSVKIEWSPAWSFVP